MQTVQQMKDDLAAAQARAVELADHAVNLADQSFVAIGQHTFWSSLVLTGFAVIVTGLAVLVGVAGFFGYSFIQNTAKSAAEKEAEIVARKVAEERTASHLQSKNFRDILSQIVEDETVTKDKTVKTKRSDGEPEFPSPPPIKEDTK